VGEQRQRRHVVALCSQQDRQCHGVEAAATDILAEGDSEQARRRQRRPEVGVEPGATLLDAEEEFHVEAVGQDLVGQVGNGLLGLVESEVHGARSPPSGLAALLAGQAEAGRTDDVALDLVGAAPEGQDPDGAVGGLDAGRELGSG